MKTQNTQNSPKHITRNKFVERLINAKKVIFMTIEYCSKIDLKSEFKNLEIYEVQYANVALGASHIKRKNKIEESLGYEVMSDAGQLAWGSLSANRKIRVHKNKAYLHGFRIRKVRTSEGYFIDGNGNRLNSETVATMRKPKAESEVQKKVGWRAYTVDKIRRFWYKGEWVLTD